MTNKITAAITAVGGYVPEDKLTNFDLEKMVDTNDEWIRTRTGISERRILKGEGKLHPTWLFPQSWRSAKSVVSSLQKLIV